MPSSATFKTASGGEPAEYILMLARGAQPTAGDALYAAQRQRTRILERTLRGVDVEGRPFEPYSQDGPYYYYPNGRVGSSKFTNQQNKSAVRRLLKRTAGVTAIRSEYGGHEGVGGTKTRTGLGIKFESYADFKASIGRAGVDLYGPRAPHMMQAIAVAVNGQDMGMNDQGTGLGGNQAPAEVFSLGIYGEAAGRASGHNTGINPRWKRRHQRHFFGASASDISAMVSDVTSRIVARLKGKE